MPTEFETEVIKLLTEIAEQLQEVVERQDRLDEAISNISTPGGDFRVFEDN